jgi:flagellar export protein FliJ
VKKFTFRLDRVMDWRRTQARIEQAKLERLFGELRNIDAREDALRVQRAESEMAMIAESATTGFALAALATFQRFAVTETIRLGTKRQECRRRIAAQMQVMADKRRDVRLLERLREDRFKTWQTELGRESDRQADEAFLARRPRE